MFHSFSRKLFPLHLKGMPPPLSEMDTAILSAGDPVSRNVILDNYCGEDK